MLIEFGELLNEERELRTVSKTAASLGRSAEDVLQQCLQLPVEKEPAREPGLELSE